MHRAGKKADVYLPIWERLEREIAAAKEREAALQRARARGVSAKRPVRPDVGALNEATQEEPITAAEWERCLDRLALEMQRVGKRGIAYLPIYERLESEIAAAKERKAALERVRKQLAPGTDE